MEVVIARGTVDNGAEEFHQGDIVDLPNKIAQVLIDEGIAELPRRATPATRLEPPPVSEPVKKDRKS